MAREVCRSGSVRPQSTVHSAAVAELGEERPHGDSAETLCSLSSNSVILRDGSPNTAFSRHCAGSARVSMNDSQS